MPKKDSDKLLKMLAQNAGAARRLAEEKGVVGTRRLLDAAARDLDERLRAVRSGDDSFTAVQLRAAKEKVRLATKGLVGGMRGHLLDLGDEAAEKSALGVHDYLQEAEELFSGVGTQPLALKPARMLDRASQGVRSSILSRIARSDDDDSAAEGEHPGRLGVLERYGVETIGEFERSLQMGMLAGKSWSDMAEELTAKSPFLEGKPAFWATRIVRTEVMGAYARGAWESSREADDELGDVVKILSATFDDRTGADSYAVHGQIRRVDEPFEWWEGLYMHPPNRPNDREVVVTHRIAWPIPPALKPKSDAQVAAAWKRQGRKGAPPERPEMTTVPIHLFGKAQKPGRKAEEAPEGEEGGKGRGDGGRRS